MRGLVNSGGRCYPPQQMEMETFQHATPQQMEMEMFQRAIYAFGLVGSSSNNNNNLLDNSSGDSGEMLQQQSIYEMLHQIPLIFHM